MKFQFIGRMIGVLHTLFLFSVKINVIVRIVNLNGRWLE